MNMQAVDLLIVFSSVQNLPAPPNQLENWVDNNNNLLIDNSGNEIVFNVG